MHFHLIANPLTVMGYPCETFIRGPFQQPMEKCSRLRSPGKIMNGGFKGTGFWGQENGFLAGFPQLIFNG
jgi:hypothetical protein